MVLFFILYVISFFLSYYDGLLHYVVWGCCGLALFSLQVTRILNEMENKNRLIKYARKQQAMRTDRPKSHSRSTLFKTLSWHAGGCKAS